jgi:hypothetical protein
MLGAKKVAGRWITKDSSDQRVLHDLQYRGLDFLVVI